jgi:transcriptional regulator with XRE-family HTH domain
MGWRFDCNRIAMARGVKDVSQLELSKLTGIAQQQISQWETGEIKPGMESLMKICNALGSVPRFFFVQSGTVGNDADKKE